MANGSGVNVSTAYNTTVTDPLPSGMTATDISNGGTLSGGTITWNLASLAPGASAVLTYDGELTSAPANGTLTNTASYSATSVPGAGARTYSGQASTSILVGGPTLSKSLQTTVGAPDNPHSQASIGDTITYTVVVTVPDGLSLPSGTVVDTLPAGLGSVAPVSATCTLAAGGDCPGFAPTFTGPSSPGAQLTWDLGTPVANGSVATITLTYSAVVIDTPGNTSSVPTALVNLAVLNWTGNSAVIEASATATVVEPALSITKAHSGADIVPPGTPIPFQVTVANGTGPNVSTAYATVVTDAVPTGMTVDPSSISSGGVLSGSTITWDLSPLAPGASQELTYTASINAAVAGGATYTNTATLTASSIPGGTAAGGRAYSVSATSTVSQAITSLSLSKSLLSTSLLAGTNATYVISVTDNGPQDAAGPITVTDDLPTGLSYVSSSSAGGFTCSAIGQVVTCATPDDVGLPNGQTISLDLTVAVASDVTGSVLNSATATTPTPDASGNPATATGSTSDPVDTVTSLSLTKSLVGALVAGSQGTYAVSVTDHGPSDAAGPITVTDTLPAGLTYVSSSSADGFTCSA
ncbi:MAG: Ig-like domain-containing protein, partial [Acidimicrobiales bacterium]